MSYPQAFLSAWRFSLTVVSEFKWSGSVHGNRTMTLVTLRDSMLQLETTIPPHFMHPAWSSFRAGWERYVETCSHTQQFASALSKLELVIKPVLFNQSWHDSLGTSPVLFSWFTRAFR